MKIGLGTTEKENNLIQVSYNQKLLELFQAQTAEVEKQTKLKSQNIIKNYKRETNGDVSFGDLNTSSASAYDQLVDIGATEEQLEKFYNTVLDKYDDFRDEIEDNPIEIKLTGWDDISDGIAGVVNGFTAMEESAKQYNDGQITAQQNNENMVSNIANMTGAMASFYDEDDDRRKKQLELQKVIYASQMAMQIAQLPGQISSAIAQSGAMAGIPGVIAMVAMLASLGIMAGGSSVSASYDDFSAQEANTGTGTVLGDLEAQSESMNNALEILEDYAQPQYETLNSMNNYLKNISDNIIGVTSLIIQTAGFALGEGFEAQNSEKFSLENSAPGWDIMSDVGELIAHTKYMDELYGTDLGEGAFSVMTGATLTNKLVNGLMGKTSQSLEDYGLNFNEQLLGSAIDSIEGQSFQTIKTKKKSWLSSSSSTNSYFEDLDNETERQFSLVLSNLYDTVVLSGNALGTSSDELENQLDNFVVNIGKLSLQDKTGDEIQEELTAVFGAIGDDLAKTTFPLLTTFQTIGEGMFETLTRVSAGVEESKYYIDKLGASFEDINYTLIENTQGYVGTEALRQSIIEFDEAMYGSSNGVVELLELVVSSAEDVYSTYTALEDTRIAFGSLSLSIDAVTQSTIVGTDGIDGLSNSLSTILTTFATEQEQVQYVVDSVTQEFNRLNLSVPTSTEGFLELVRSIDTTTDSGQELFGRVLSLADSFSELSEIMEASQENIDGFIGSFKSDERLLQDASSNIGIGIAEDWDELGESLALLSSDLEGLTDDEVSFLELNSSYIQDLLAQEEDLLEAKKELNDEYLTEIESSISTVESIISSLESEIVKLRDAADDENTYLLNKFNESLEESKALSKTDDYDALNESLSDTISYSSALYDADNFPLTRDMEYAQLAAAKAYEDMDVTLNDELDYLRMIEENTRLTVEALTAEIANLSTSIDNSSNYDYVADILQNAVDNNDSPSKNEQLVSEYYQKAVGRSPDQEGLEYWTGRLDRGEIGENNLLSSMLKVGAISGELSRDEVVTAIYKYGLGRNPDSSGYDYWMNENSTATANLYEVMSSVNGESFTPFAKGTPRVPKDMIAQIHKDEIITPATYSDGLRSGELYMGNMNGINEIMQTSLSGFSNKFDAIMALGEKQLQKLTDSYNQQVNTNTTLTTIAGRI